MLENRGPRMENRENQSRPERRKWESQTQNFLREAALKANRPHIKMHLMVNALEYKAPNLRSQMWRTYPWEFKQISSKPLS